MLKNTNILTVNSSFPEMEHFAAGLAKEGLLSCHVRPYANKKRGWEHTLEHLPFLGKAYGRTIGRRTLVKGLPSTLVREHAITLDLCMALAVRVTKKNRIVRSIDKVLSGARACSIARAGAETLCGEDAVVACWGVAEPVFKKIKKRGGLCVLNYSLAHHAFTKNFLLDEAKREPAFADTLNSCDWPNSIMDRMNSEIALADKILVGSSFVRDSFLYEQVPEEKLTVVSYGVDTNLFSPAESSFHRNRFNVLFVGQIGQRKGISYLLEAYRLFRGHGTTLTLVGRIQGDGQAFRSCRHMFKHISHRPQNELCKIYQEADVFLFPTLLEGMPLVVLEAMSCGIPVVTTPNGPSDIVRNGMDGYIVPPRDVDAIIDRLQRLRRDPELRTWMGRNARKRAMSFSWEVYRKKVVGHVKEWLQKSPAGQSHNNRRENLINYCPIENTD